MNGQNLINRAVEEQTDTRIEHLVFFSGGIGSWAAAKRLALRDDVDALSTTTTLAAAAAPWIKRKNERS